MDYMEKEYAAFERAMDEDRIYREVSDYSEICLRIGVGPVELNVKIYEELGYFGQDIVDFYRRCENIH